MPVSNSNSFDYQERVVAFIDVLGFAELVRRSDTNPTVRAKVRNLIAVNKLFEQFAREFLGFAEAAFFSDSFVLSMPQPDARALFMIREVGYLCRYLLLQGLPCRGAITTGSLYHYGRFVIGPAFVSAFELEKSVAIYPRVVLDDATIRHWQNEFRPETPHPDFELLVKRDCDGQFFLDIFNPGWTTTPQWTKFIKSCDQVPIDQVEFLKMARIQIEDGLVVNSGNPKVRIKYEWLATQLSEYASASP